MSTASSRCIPFTPQQKLRAGIDARWDRYRYSSVSLDGSPTTALVTGILNYRPHPSTFSAWLYSRELHEARLLDVLDLAASSALTTPLWRCARFRARTIAFRATFGAWHVDFRLVTSVRLLERHLHVVPYVLPTLWSSSSSSATEECIEDGTESSAEPKTDVPENFVEVYAAEYVLRRVSSINAGMTEAVVLRSLLVVGEYGVGFRDFFEPGFGFGRLVSVGVVFEGEFPVFAFYLVLARVTRYPKYIVVVTFRRQL
jgi:hypothetical protein